MAVNIIHIDSAPWHLSRVTPIVGPNNLMDGQGMEKFRRCSESQKRKDYHPKMGDQHKCRQTSYQRILANNEI